MYIQGYMDSTDDWCTVGGGTAVGGKLASPNRPAAWLYEKFRTRIPILCSVAIINESCKRPKCDSFG